MFAYFYFSYVIDKYICDPGGGKLDFDKCIEKLAFMLRLGKVCVVSELSIGAPMGEDPTKKSNLWPCF